GEGADHVRALGRGESDVRAEKRVRDERREAIERLLELRRRGLALAAVPEPERELVATRDVPWLEAQRAPQRLVAFRAGAEHARQHLVGIAVGRRAVDGCEHWRLRAGRIAVL